MTDVQPTTPENIERTPSGEIKDQTPQPSSPDSTSTKPATESAPATTEGKSLLNQEGEAPAGAPEKYEAFVAPEGWEAKGWELDQATIEKATPLFKELGLSQDQAQKLVNFYAETSAAAHDETIQTTMSMRREWTDQVKADPEIGGAKLNQTRATVSKAINSVLGQELGGKFRSALDLTGAGDHPDIIRALNKWALALGERTHAVGTGPSKFGQQRPGEQPESAARALYPNLA